MARFFIDRPIFAWVLAIVLMLAGALAINTLPVAQYPSIAPPQIGITVTYPGASAETVQNTVVQVIEQQMSGLDGLLYFSSQSNKDGSISINLSFAQGTDPDTAQVQVQNKLSLAQPRLPQAVQQQGIRVAKATTNFLMVIGFISKDGSMDGNAIADYIASYIQDPLSRTPGVGDYQLFGAQRAMRIWLDPVKLNNYALTTSDVTTAIAAQNVQIASGELGALPQQDGQQLNATIIGPSYLQTPGEFGAILLKVNANGSQVRLRDVARIELGSESYSTTSVYNGQPSSALAVKLASGANALQAAANVRATLERLRPSYPQGLEVVYPYDTTPFVSLSIEEVVRTLFEAILLVFLVMYLFLQNFRATLIPTLAVPVVLLGTFGVLWAVGFTINTLTMFAMVLAIGLLVDDAIVVVENVERVMEEDKLSPLEATRRSMDQISGALVGIALVLSAVFLPMAFLGGSSGVIYRQFSITIVSAMALSVLTALIFTPALCATLLKAPKHGHGPKRGLFGWFNRFLAGGTQVYGGGVRHMLNRRLRWLVVYGLVVGGMVFLFLRLPTSFLPNEDQGMMFVQVTAPPGAAAGRTNRALEEVSNYLLHEEASTVKSVLTVAGFSFGGRGQNAGIAFISLKDWKERSTPQQSVNALAGRFMRRFGGYRDAMIFAFPPPPIIELGNATGFDFQLVDQAGLGHDTLMSARNQLLGMAAQNPLLAAVRPNGLDDEPQYRLVIDWERASAQGLTVSDINNTVSAALASTYVNDFLDRGRIKRVYVQGDISARMQPSDLDKWYVRNSSGQMVPFSAFATARWGHGSPKLERYNGVPSMEILGTPAPGQSTGTAMAEMERLASRLPTGIGYEWTGLSYEEQQAGSKTFALYALSLLVVFLCLAALYESWAIPVAVLLAAPLGVAGAVLATWSRGLENDIYFQVSLLTTIGLTAKNAILIVEFAKAGFDRGEDLVAATLEAARQRLRPILMTSLAFMLGVLPLAISNGAGSGGQNAIGTGVIGGMLAGTLLAILFVPLFFVLVLKLFRTRPAAQPQDSAAHPALGQ
ncbi:multidrug efflux pump RND permease AcrB [Rhodovastum atsumiense]|uniref:Efflux pump membrane transporter n=1 Tax=Rhodovastum atsumiense TaxID=504468 RepID=A0A5M6J190_9PROT|nr:efflux RND transporter permease subunit [Rhodovastum atsumiense]KAA5613398.1 efflux RND transporter permease subunit [Rhodovastum atsumiense]CAH2603101.1 multidrug efflux pump RND permease AcrB [Rhodovastum atsumiense]